MSEPTAADRLRRRAVVLRTLATRIDHLGVLSVHGCSGADTWVGPSPQACDDGLRSRGTQLRRAATDLRAEARRFERLADDLTAIALASGPR